jgi:uncharacterized protein Smg (DUF494 family)
MQERIIEIIIFLLEKFQQKPDKENYLDLSQELVDRGYTDNEINLAFSWISNHLQSRTTDLGVNYAMDTDRSYEDLEKLIITPEAYGYLLQLFHLGMLKDYDIEDVIDRAVSKGSNQVTLEDVKAIAVSLIFESDMGNGKNFFYQSGTNSLH